MNILLISQCNKNALKETRRILDQFAERRGARTWQTPITKAGLDTLRKLLRKKARKNTAVACHWIRGKDHSELLWIVGDAKRFNPMGASPTNSTRRNILRTQNENDWHCGEEIKLLASLAALLHDLGKACDQFQEKLKPNSPLERNLYRHEWISLRLFQAFVGQSSDDQWLQRLIDHAGDEHMWKDRLERDGITPNTTRPFAPEQLPPLAQAVAWLVLSHHRLPIKPNDGNNKPVIRAEHLSTLLTDINASWNERCDSNDHQEISPYWTFSGPLPVISPKWQEAAKRIATQLQKRRNSALLTIDNSYVMHLARLCLMLADHNYSSLTDPRHRDWVCGTADYPLYANTLRSTGKYNQKLDAHLLGVARMANQISRSLPSMADHLPRLGHHPGLRKRTREKRFQWQNKAFELTESLRKRSEQSGFFGINMASTGCGKTIANGRIMYALANPQKGARFSIALGLRTLTLQTGRAFQQMLNLNDSDLAIRVGGSATRALFEHYEAEAEASGSASSVDLLADSSHVHFEGNFDNHGVLKRLEHNPMVKKLIAAPILTCTVDHLIPATESTRGGRQIAPMLRLMSSDLVLDEIDDFDIQDLPALTRLVHWAAMLGARVLLSSATLPPALVAGLFESYREGRQVYQRNRGEPNTPVDICCAWFDEHQSVHSDCANREQLTDAHIKFVKKRFGRLEREQVRRLAQLVTFAPPFKKRAEIRADLAEVIRHNALHLHQAHHTVDPTSQKRISFGLVRMANIEPLVDVAIELFKLGASTGHHIHLCVYHSQFPLLLRSNIEQQLDTTLNRREEMAVFSLPQVRHLIDQTEAQDQLFIVLGSPVTEVGRDHDYDWSVVEPSSMRSLIQLAGRIKRHRLRACEEPNLYILSTNLRALENQNEPAFCRPGFEDRENRLNSHNLNNLLQPEQWRVIDARPRIQPREKLQPTANLVDLEHHQMQDKMVATPTDETQSALSDEEIRKLSPKARRRLKRTPASPPLGAYSWYMQPQAQLCGVLTQRQSFRDDPIKKVDLALLPDEDEVTAELHYVYQKNRKEPATYSKNDRLLKRIELESLTSPGISVWGSNNYMDSLIELAEELDMDLERCAKRFGTLSLPEPKDDGLGWRFHPALGFSNGK
ncbi:type I-F CRISPR-associated helicase Cas3f [Pontibacterium granulatum]|uniref:type I-F CRISPR-associated helicase Cas3f n=1 Tax=Pontibacterium granulatum TaxID=2036029 RepID=UPI002499FD40|nr:type I-F CRISPR-associated helicase Cas3f [Pontibacterium granulatum]MDI3323424.1 type I-F CRISPR-associated helicase Cas3f [Pontibacterium granulatum]